MKLNRFFAGVKDQSRNLSPALKIVLILLAIEAIDETIGGVWLTALPQIQTDLALSYTQLGLLSTIPDLISNLIEPAIGVWGDLGYRRRLIVAGGIGFAAAVGLIALSQNWEMLLLSFVLLNPASGAFVSLSQATLMDLEPTRHAQNMARWGLAGSVGAVAGTLAASTAIVLHWGWRSVFWVIGLLALALALLISRQTLPKVTHAVANTDVSAVKPSSSFFQALKNAIRTLRRLDIVCWLFLLEMSDLMLDHFTTLLPLYLIAVSHFTAVEAGFAVTLCLGVGLIGDFLLIPVLERVDGLRYLRMSALLMLLLFPAFLLIANPPAKLVLVVLVTLTRTGWYPILKGQLYGALPGQSSSVMTLQTIWGYGANFIPVGLGLMADHYGLNLTLWLLLIAPVSILVGIKLQNSL